ncbi:MAG: acyl-CoA thioesterase [Gammaproteobacteria bacterium]|nr:acyl-CoA thioesterase [Gammaproteobacteria bacterium]
MEKKLLATPQPVFQTEIPVQISHINYGNHVGFDAMVSLLHEAQVQFLKNYHYQEIDIEGRFLVVQKIEVLYKREAFYGDDLTFVIGIGDITKVKLELQYLVKNTKQEEVCRAEITVVFIDQASRRVVSPPAFFQTLKEKN